MVSRPVSYPDANETQTWAESCALMPYLTHDPSQKFTAHSLSGIGTKRDIGWTAARLAQEAEANSGVKLARANIFVLTFSFLGNGTKHKPCLVFVIRSMRFLLSWSSSLKRGQLGFALHQKLPIFRPNISR